MQKNKKINIDEEEKRKNNQNIIKRITYTLAVLLALDLLSYVTIPGVDPKKLSVLASNPSLTMLSMFSGGGFSNFSVMSMGLSSYISAQIIVQLLQAGVVPKWTEWSKQGQAGREKLSQATRVLTLILGFIQAVGIIAGINEITDYGFLLDTSIWNFCIMGLLLTAGTFIAMFAGDMITENGIGNGISVIIAAGIVKRIPSMVRQFWGSVKTNISFHWNILIITLIILIVMVLLIVWAYRSELRLPIQYSRRETMTGKSSYLPLKIIVAGVVPIVFASSILSIPQTILLMFESSKNTTAYRVIQEFFTMNSNTGAVLYAVLIFLFSYLYSLVQIDPDKLAENLEKQEAYIPSVYPGTPTAVFIKQKLYELDLPGSLVLSVISLIPLIAANTLSPSLEMGLSGSSILILIGVVEDISRQIEGLKLSHQYQPILNKEYSFD